MKNQESSKRVLWRTLLCVFSIGLMASVMALPAPVHANSAKEKAKAKAAFRKGIKLYDAENYVEASKVFREAYENSPHWKLFYNIAQCEAASRHYGLALDAFESYLISGGDDVPTDRQDEVRREISRLRDLCGDVEIEAPPGSDVFINDVKRGRTPIASGIPIGAGMHVVKIVRDGVVLLEQEVQVRGAKTVTIKAGAAAAPGPPEAKPGGETEPSAETEPAPEEMPASPEDLPPNRMLVIGSVLTAVGGATLIAGVVTGSVSRAKTKDLEDKCPDKQCLDPGDETLHDQASNLSLATDVLLPAGAAIAIAGVVLVMVGRKKESANEPNAELAVAAGAGYVGAAFTRRF